MKKILLLKIICLIIYLFIALNAVVHLLTLSNTIANITGVILFILNGILTTEVLIEILNLKK